MTKVVLIIQARMGSVRLPGKSMMDLCGKPLIGHILERVKRVTKIDQIVVATSTNVENDPLENLALKYEVECFRGSEDDLLRRYYDAAMKFNASTVLRLPADNVCPEPFAYDRLIEYHVKSNNDFSSNICGFMGEKWPDGIGIEAIEFESLKHAHEHNHRSDQREHVALNFYDYINDCFPSGSLYSVGTIPCPKEISRPDISLDINTNEDFVLMKSLYQSLYPINPEFSITEIISWFDQRREK